MRYKLIIGGSIFVIFSIFIALTFPANNLKSPILLSIKSGSSLNSIVKQLKQRDIIGSESYFKILAYLNFVTSSLKSGEYSFEGGESYLEVLDKLVDGKTLLVKVTIPEGYNVNQIFEALEEKGIGRKENYIKINADKVFLKNLNLRFKKNLTSLEGFLFPETYNFSKSTDEKVVVKEMLNTFLSRIPKDYDKLCARIGLTAYEGVILASIIEKETSVGSERKKISSVFHNRLKKRIPLATDPTVIYGIKNFDGNLTRKHLRQKTPYNTYRFRGLTPTPISNPGMDSLLAATDPDKTNYLYFVAKGDGSHYFSKTFAEHNRAVNRYQRRKRKPSSTYRSY